MVEGGTRHDATYGGRDNERVGGQPREEFNAHFEDMISTIRDESGYGVWHVPVVAARVSGG